MRFFKPGMPALKTARLSLVAMTPEMLRADAALNGSLAHQLGADLSADWPPVDFNVHVIETIAAQAHKTPQNLGWHRYVLLAKNRRRVLIGCVGGFPKQDGVVEIGYSILPEFQRQGFGTEAVSAHVEWLLKQQGVQGVTAQTFIHMLHSIKVMSACGLVFVGPGDDEGTVRYRRSR